MLKELKIAMEKEQVVSIHTKDGEVLMGTPEKTSMQAKVKLRNEDGITFIPYEDIVHVMRVIDFP
ncbi:hypothetical protein [Paenibacillus monticola]|uniref:DUF2642 domain-containing protein n=1 Tax=Paenibacillus monticola TaxID=2666075 RepID=A0A7X2HB51_9BACL|nr:hypothetical protein [Paenibacillus monticola]MRN56861.1 hypothetical protein [Paenibacillus monticola]